MNSVNVGNKVVGSDSVFIVAEIGLNHNGDINLAKQLIDVAHEARCDAVKFQKRTPHLCVPDEYKTVKRETPWGLMTYLEYRERIEFGETEYDEIDRYCKENGMMWSASPWDLPSIDFLKKYDVPFYKVPSSLLTHKHYLLMLKNLHTPVFLSTGMSNMEMVESAVRIVGQDRLVLFHATGSYPAPLDDINLRVIPEYKKRFQCPIGYSGHEVGLQVTLAAVTLGASAVERHITLDRAMWGTDQSASLEPKRLTTLVRDIRVIERALGDGVKRIFESERPVLNKLRKVNDLL